MRLWGFRIELHGEEKSISDEAVRNLPRKRNLSTCGSVSISTPESAPLRGWWISDIATVATNALCGSSRVGKG